jgi:ketosteroid isomerase-like protein
MTEHSSVAALKAVLDAFNAHDLDRIMSFFADDCVLEMPRGADPWGTRYTGSKAVREGLQSRFAGIPDVHYSEDTHFVAGNVGVSQWTLRGTTNSGEKVEVRGCDSSHSRTERSSKRDSYWKIRDQ